MNEGNLTFDELIALYELGHMSSHKLPSLAIEAISNNMNSESMCIVAGMSIEDSSLEIKEYFDRAMCELNFNYENKIDAAKILCNYYVNEILRNRSNCYGGINLILNNCWDRIFSDVEERHKFFNEVEFSEIYDVWSVLDIELSKIDYNRQLKGSSKNKTFNRFIDTKELELKQLLAKWQDQFLMKEVDGILKEKNDK